MDPLTSLVTALVAGAATALKPTVEQAVKDSYAALKGFIQRKYAQVNLDQLETNPSSKSRRGVVEEDPQGGGGRDRCRGAAESPRTPRGHSAPGP
jgi:hypothetical protein